MTGAVAAAKASKQRDVVARKRAISFSLSNRAGVRSTRDYNDVRVMSTSAVGRAIDMVKASAFHIVSLTIVLAIALATQVKQRGLAATAATQPVTAGEFIIDPST